MISINSSYIKETKNNTFIVKLFKHKRKRIFDTLQNALSYAEEHLISLINTNEIASVSVKYTRSDSRSSYIIWEKQYFEDGTSEIIFFEESEYDYIDTHELFFPKNKKNKIINESYYSFHDFIRVKILTTDRNVKLLQALNFISFAVGFIMFFYGMHAVNLTSHSNQIFSVREKIWLSFSLTITSIIVMISSIISSISTYMPFRSLKKNEGSLENINWRKLNNSINNLNFWIISLSISSLAPFIFSMHTIYQKDIWSDTSTEIFAFIILNIGVWTSLIIIGLSKAIILIMNVIFFKTKVKKYFNDDEVVVLKRWLHNNGIHVVYKTDFDFFTLKDEKRRELAAEKLKEYYELRNSITTEELKELKKRTFTHYKTAVKKYTKSQQYKKLEVKNHGHFL